MLWVFATFKMGFSLSEVVPDEKIFLSNLSTGNETEMVPLDIYFWSLNETCEKKKSAPIRTKTTIKTPFWEQFLIYVKMFED